jgi:alkylhydroperoxidase/carboxymuconolactone decarboxylase family protein YurZ
MAGIPSAYLQLRRDHPGVSRAYEALGEACAAAGPLDPKTIALLKLGISMGAGLQGAAHSHARKALDAGWSPAELLHAALLCAPTLGWPSMMRARGWIQDVVGPCPRPDTDEGRTA